MSAVPTPEPLLDTPDAPLWGLAAVFDTPAKIMHGAEATRERGYHWVDCHTPVPVHGLDWAMGVKYTILPILVFFGGLTGLCVAIFLQTFTNSFEIDIWALVPVVGYQFEVSGKPLISTPAFVPVAFELTVLLSALTTVFGMLALNKLPCLYHPVLKTKHLKRITDDRFVLVIEAGDPEFVMEDATEFLRSLDPESIVELEA